MHFKDFSGPEISWLASPVPQLWTTLPAFRYSTAILRHTFVPLMDQIVSGVTNPSSPVSINTVLPLELAVDRNLISNAAQKVVISYEQPIPSPFRTCL